MHEIVTLQIGSQSNYVGTHFWNTQESYFTYGPNEESPVDHDVHFRPGVGSDNQETYTPRALIYDFKGAFGTLKQVNELYEIFGDEGSSETIWPGAPMPQRQPPIQQNEYQRRLHLGLEAPELTSADVRFWSDYNRVFYHPRSLVQIHDAELDPGSRSFETWQSGVELFSTLDKEHELFERDLRPFLEECDQLQGIQIFASADDGWAGFTNQYLERARDEVEKLPIMVWMLGKEAHPTQPRSVNMSIAQARSVWETAANSSIYLPVTTGLPETRGNINIEKTSAWSTSAFQLTGIETITLPTRLKGGNSGNAFRFGDMELLLNNDGKRKIAELAFEVNAEHSARVVNGTSAHETQQHRDMSDFFPGAPEEEVESGHTEFSKLQLSRGKFANDDEAMTDVDAGRGRDYDEVRTERLRSGLEFPILDSFPQLYGKRSECKQVSVQASLSTTSRVGTWLRSVERSARRYIPMEDREDMSNALISAAEEYEGPSFGDDDDWDD